MAKLGGAHLAAVDTHLAPVDAELAFENADAASVDTHPAAVDTHLAAVNTSDREDATHPGAENAIQPTEPVLRFETGGVAPSLSP